MMAVSFDLISDLHVESWPERFDWTGVPTSPVCVLAGDVSKNREMTIETLAHLTKVYQTVMYIDGNDEHKPYWGRIDESYADLRSHLARFDNLIWLKERVAVVDGVAFIGVNGWWTFDFDEQDCYDATKQWMVDQYNVSMEVGSRVEEDALIDATYLQTGIQRLQTHQDVKEIVIVSHTVPFPELIEHDIDLQGTHMLNCAGNSHLGRALTQDTEGKISTWCFGHYHNDIDTMFKGVRFVNNPRGRGQTKWCKAVYYPKKIFL